MDNIEIPKEMTERDQGIRDTLENYSTVFMHNDLVDKLRKFSMIKGESWESDLGEILDRASDNVILEDKESGKVTGKNKKRFTI